MGCTCTGGLLALFTTRESRKMSKGSKQRPTNLERFEDNHTRIFGKSRLQKQIEADWEKCPFCGFRMEEPCESPPPDMCDKALEKLYNERKNAN